MTNKKANENKKYECEDCGDKFTVRSNLNRHRASRCDVVINKKGREETETIKKELEKDYENKIENLKLKFELEKSQIQSQLNQLIVKLEQYEKQEQAFKEQIVDLKQQLIQTNQVKDDMMKSNTEITKTALNQAGSVVNTSINALTYAKKHFTSAPPLKKLADASKIIKKADEDEDDIETTMIRKFRNGTLTEFVTDKIVNLYKKDNRKEQSLWSVDEDRKNYIICYTADNKSEWKNDKKGIKITQDIITPVIKRIEDRINKKIIELAKLKADGEDINKENFDTATELSDYINKKKLTKDVLNLMTPKFYLHRQ